MANKSSKISFKINSTDLSALAGPHLGGELGKTTLAPKFCGQKVVYL